MAVETRSSDTCTVGALARVAGVSPDTIRHYERLGILPRAARTPAGYRVWARREVEYLKWVRPAKRAGFTLRELAEVFRMYRGGVCPCQVVRDLLQQKLHGLDAQIAELIAFRRGLGRTLGAWDDRLQRLVPGEFAYLLDDLPDLRHPKPKRLVARTPPASRQSARELAEAAPRRDPDHQPLDGAPGTCDCASSPPAPVAISRRPLEPQNSLPRGTP